MNSHPIRVLIVDDHAMVRTGISAWIDTQPDLALVGEASNGQEAVQRTGQMHPDVVLMDLVMPVMDGIAATRAILEANPEVKVLVVTSFSEKERAVQAIRAGAAGFILKDTTPQEMLEAIVSVSRGRPWLSPDLTRLLFEDPLNGGHSPEGEAMTDREHVVLLLVAQGLADLEIAERLVISKSTVRYHLNNILSKLHLENRTQAALYAIRTGLVKF